MSSTSPPSFLDDGASYAHRAPRSPSTSRIPTWLAQTRSSVSSYSGSFIDDGNDLLPASAPTAAGFGRVDAKYYKQRKRKPDASNGTWNADIGRAVGGDMLRSLARLRGAGGVGVGEATEGSEERKKEKEKGVMVPVPVKWPTFVIKAGKGRVIVVGPDGEFDSAETVDGKGEREARRWVRARSETGEERRKERKTRGEKELVVQIPKKLSTIAESEYEEEQAQDALVTEVGSPTDFFMTGAVGGWPSSASESFSGSSTERPDSPVPHSSTSRQSGSTRYSLVSDRPSPPPSSTRDRYSSRSSRKSTHSQAQSAQSLRNSGKSPAVQRAPSKASSKVSSKPPSKARSTKSYSTYKAPTVATLSDTWSQSSHVQSDTPSGAILVGGITSEWNDEDKQSEKSIKIPGKIQVVNYDDALRKAFGKKTTNRTSSHSAETFYGDQGFENQEGQDDSAWDGYEIPKSDSEVGVLGSDDGSYSMHTQNRSIHSSRSGSQRSGGSKHSHVPSKEAPRASRMSWNSQKARVDDDGWTASEKSVEGWVRSNRGSIKGSSSRGASLSSASQHGWDDQAPAKHDWDEVEARSNQSSVKARPRRSSAAEWD